MTARTHIAGTMRGGALARLAGQLCNRTSFQVWAEERAGSAPEGVSRMQSAAEFIRRECGIHSRAELDHNAEAASAFHARIRQPFLDHQDKLQSAWASTAPKASRALYCGFELSAAGRAIGRDMIVQLGRDTISAPTLSSHLVNHMRAVEPWSHKTPWDAARAAAEDLIWIAVRAGVLDFDHVGRHSGIKQWKRAR